MEYIPTVAVLMSTYNGEKYIREQLDSIFKQENVHVRLYVRDDGSTDNTVNIIKEYSEHYPIELYVDGENVRPGESFMRLVYKYAETPGVDYYAFADQDDIWCPEKLKIAIAKVVKFNNDIPVLYSSNQYIYKDGINCGNRHKEPQRIDLISHMTKNTIAGCTFVFNKSLAQLVAKSRKPDYRILKYRLHDAWLMLVAIACGKVIYDDSSHMLYRIHSENAVGVKKVSVFTRLEKLKRFFVKRDDANLRLITAKEMLRIFPQIPKDKKRILFLYSEYQKSWKRKKALAFNKKIKANCAENPHIFTIKVLMNFV